MPRLRRNEWNFSANAAQIISELLGTESFSDSLMGHAEAELTEFRGNRRLDLVIFGREDREEPLVTGELKVPWDPLGRTPYNRVVLEDAYGKAGNAGAQFFITWNIRRVVVWKTDDPGVPLPNRVVYDKEIITRDIKDQQALARPDLLEQLRAGIADLLRFMSSLFSGAFITRFLPIDRLFIARLEAALDYPISATTIALNESSSTDTGFRLMLEKWMREDQGWVVNPAAEAENFNRAARFTCYVLVNRLCFYNALRRKYPQMPRLSIDSGVRTKEALERRLERAFADARRFTGDYDTVFDGDFGDSLPFLSNAAISDWRELIRLLDNYDFAHIDVDVIGAMYERLITPTERHRYGQHYTQPRVVELMSALSIETANDAVLDPGCGGGTFLVGAYKRRSALDSQIPHSELIATLYGCDVLQYACHLTTINLAIRDLIDDDNFPRIHRGDFLAYQPGEVFSSQPIRLQAGGLPIGHETTQVAERSIDVVIGNPPYINAREIPAGVRSKYLTQVQRAWPGYEWRRSSDIYLYFWLHAARFLRNGGRLALLTQSGWLDGDFGVPLQAWMLDNFEIETIIESDAEPWFTGARVATAITILRKVETPSREHLIRFVAMTESIEAIVSKMGGETLNALASVIKNQKSLPGLMRIRLIKQGELEDEGRSDGRYMGSRWGRFLRTPDVLYDLYGAHRSRFVKLSELAIIRRGLTTNCDDFFLVENISAESLARVPSGKNFRDYYGVLRHKVQSGEFLIIKRKDGVEFALPSSSLVRILKTARDFSSFSTASLPARSLAVSFHPERGTLTPLEERYVAAGEREGWHFSPSFEKSRAAWFVLRGTSSSPILFPKTSQYVPVVLLNDAALIANQRLYEIIPREGVDAAALHAVLNSSHFAFEKYTAAKSLGREAAIDIEVFTAESLLVPDLRTFDDELIEELGRCGSELLLHTPTAALDDELMNFGRSASLEYVARTPVSPQVWPEFMRSSARRGIDRVVLKGIGLQDEALDDVRDRLCNDLLRYTRRLKLLEFQAQENRRGNSYNAKTSPRELAEIVLKQIVSSEQMVLRQVPQDFIPAHAKLASVLIPAHGRLRLKQPELFRASVQGLLGKHQLTFPHMELAKLVALLARLGLSGRFELPAQPDHCHATEVAIEEYVSSFEGELIASVAQLSSDPDYQLQVASHGMKLILSKARRA